MKSVFTQTLRSGLLICLLLYGSSLSSQTAKGNKTRAAGNPESFSVSRAEFDKLYDAGAGAVFSSASSRQLNKAKVLINSRNGDMQFVRLKLSGIPKAYLAVQVNGSYSTQVFILLDDHSISYKGKIGDSLVTFTKCDEDEIVSE
jgi:hypothetical protein